MNLSDRNQEMRKFFNDKIDTYDQVHEEYMDTKRTLIEQLDGRIEKVLDLGAGTGLELIYLFEKYPNARVTVVDISENMLNELRKRSFADKVTCVCGDFFEVPFGNDYDAVISTSALHHFSTEDKIKLYRKILECLKSGGQFINCDKVALSQEEQDKCLKEYQEAVNRCRHIDTPLTKENECIVLNEVGFKNVMATTPETIKDNYALIKALKK